ncbi:MAG: hypothetical protein ACI8VC_001015 [Candidatus Endobugula sp.]|jgi:hypothetical protein
MAIGAFLSMTVPETLCMLHDSNLPELPWFHLNMKRSRDNQSPIVNALAEDIVTELSQLSNNILIEETKMLTLDLTQNHNQQSPPSG